MDYKIPKNVNDFMTKCSKEIGKYEAENFGRRIWEWCDNFTESPIEQILYCALETIRRVNDIEEYDFHMYVGEIPLCKGLNIESQKKFNKYRVDFLISYYRIRELKQEIKKVIIECDSQKFHERTEKERRYEKQRDRYLQLEGYKIFHYTGSEIMKNPLEIAREIIAYVTNMSIEDLCIDSDIED